MPKKPFYLCTFRHTNETLESVKFIQSKLNLSEEEIVRTAVKFFCENCVPTQEENIRKTACPLF